MSGYDTKKNVDEYWTYSDLLEMIYIEDLNAINAYKSQKAIEDQRELEDLLKQGR